MNAYYFIETEHMRRTISFRHLRYVVESRHIWRIILITAAFLLAVVFDGAGFFRPSASSAESIDPASLVESDTLRVKFIKDDAGDRLEFGSLSGYKSKGYSIFQGACSDGEHSYHVLYNKKKERCRIIKIEPASYDIIKVSPSYKMYHGNDIAYDSRRDRLVVVHGDGDTKRLSIFDPDTLKRTRIVKLKFSKAFKGASAKTARKLKGLTGIAYDEKHDRFIGSLKSTFHYVILNPKFKPVKLIRTATKNDKLQKQGMDITGKYILRIMNIYKKKTIQNFFYVYNMKGRLVKRIPIRTTSEIESSYFLNGNLYAATYIEKGKGRKFRNWSYILKLGSGT